MKQGFRGNCGFKGKLGMCPSLAEPLAISFPKSKSVFLLFTKLQFQKYFLETEMILCRKTHFTPYPMESMP